MKQYRAEHLERKRKRAKRRRKKVPRKNNLGWNGKQKVKVKIKKEPNNEIYY